MNISRVRRSVNQMSRHTVTRRRGHVVHDLTRGYSPTLSRIAAIDQFADLEAAGLVSLAHLQSSRVWNSNARWKQRHVNVLFPRSLARKTKKGGPPHVTPES